MTTRRTLLAALAVSFLACAGAPGALLPSAPNPATNLKILTGSFKSEHSSLLSYYPWKVTLYNGNDYPVSVVLTLGFLDKDGFVVQEAFEFGQVLQPGNNTLQGKAMTMSPNRYSATDLNVGLKIL